jgi:hypothetical protein
VRLSGPSVYECRAPALTRNGLVGMYGSGWVSLQQSTNPEEYEPTRMPSSSSKCEQVSTQTRSPSPTCRMLSTVSVDSSSWGVVASNSRASANTSSALRGVNRMPSEPRSRTSKTMAASSRPSTTVTSLPSADSAAASTISSGILVGSAKWMTVYGNAMAPAQDSVRVRSSRTSMNPAAGVPPGRTVVRGEGVQLLLGAELPQVEVDSGAGTGELPLPEAGWPENCPSQKGGWPFAPPSPLSPPCHRASSWRPRPRAERAAPEAPVTSTR